MAAPSAVADGAGGPAPWPPGAIHENRERTGLPTTYPMFLILPYDFHLPAIRLER